MPAVLPQDFQTDRWVTLKLDTLTWVLDVSYIRSLQESRKQFRMETSLIIKHFQKQQRIVKRITLPFIYTDYYPMVVYTATTHIFTLYQSLQRDRGLQTYAYTVSQMAVTQLQHLVKNLSKNQKQKSKKSVQARSHLSKVVTMQWTEITVGIVQKKLTLLQFTVKVMKQQMQQRQFRLLMIMIRQMSSLSLQ